MKNKWFTLIELMIVIAIIWVLVTALYPQLGNYLDRANVVKYQSSVKEVIQTIHNYEAENWTLSTVGWWQLLCEGTCSYWNPRQDELSDYITRNNPKLWTTLTGLTFPPFSEYTVNYWTIDLATWSSYGRNSFPGKDMTSMKIIPAITWAIPKAPGLTFWTWISLSGNNMPLSVTKRCSPGIAYYAENYYDWGEGSTFNDTYCVYFFE